MIKRLENIDEDTEIMIKVTKRDGEQIFEIDSISTTPFRDAGKNKEIVTFDIFNFGRQRDKKSKNMN